MDQPDTPPIHDNTLYEVAVIGAGPIGLEVAACLRGAGVPYIHFDARQIGHTLTWWPRNTHFFSTTERLGIAGLPIQNNHQQRVTGEEYLAYLRAVVEFYDLQIRTHEPITALVPDETGFVLTSAPATGERCYRSRRVVIAVGDMEHANRLEIPGEDLPHVSHYFRDPHDYFRKRLLIVGGRNSAVEAALRCWRAGARVTISYRQARFDQRRVKHWLLPDIDAQIEAGAIGFLPETVPVRITPSAVELVSVADGRPRAEPPIVIESDFVLLNTGFRGDQRLLRMAGVTLVGEQQIPTFDAETMETNVKGVYVAGTVAAGVQRGYTLFIENTHEHAGKIVAAITGRWPAQLESPSARSFSLPLDQIEAN